MQLIASTVYGSMSCALPATRCYTLGAGTSLGMVSFANAEAGQRSATGLQRTLRAIETLSLRFRSMITLGIAMAVLMGYC